MNKIQVLDPVTIDKIAAGEVIERPASVVKELVENAIDAGATAITAEIREGGIGFIRITDNGCGIKREELPLAFLRHSTSKIRSAEDLLTVSSLGFRGEALSSISAVSQVELITKTPEYGRQPDRLPVPDRGRAGKEPGGGGSARRHHVYFPEPVLQYPGPAEVLKDRGHGGSPCGGSGGKDRPVPSGDLHPSDRQ